MCLRPYVGPREGALSYERGTPVHVPTRTPHPPSGAVQHRKGGFAVNTGISNTTHHLLLEPQDRFLGPCSGPRRRRLNFRVKGEPCTLRPEPVHVVEVPHVSPRPLSSEYDTYKRVKARLWPWLSGKSAQTLLSCSLFARQRTSRNASDAFRMAAAAACQPARSVRKQSSLPFFITLKPRAE